MQWYRYWAICEYSGVLTHSPQTCENLSVLEKEILKEGGGSQTECTVVRLCFILVNFTVFFTVYLCCFCFWVPFSLLQAGTLFVKFSIHWTCYCIGSVRGASPYKGRLYVYTDFNQYAAKKKEDGIRWINRAVMFNIFLCGKTETKQNWKTTTKGKEVITAMKASWLDSILISFI